MFVSTAAPLNDFEACAVLHNHCVLHRKERKRESNITIYVGPLVLLRSSS